MRRNIGYSHPVEPRIQYGRVLSIFACTTK